MCVPTGGIPTWWGPTARFPFWERESEARTHKRSVVSKDFKVWIRLVMTMAIVMVAWLVPIQGEAMVAPYAQKWKQAEEFESRAGASAVVRATRGGH